MRLRPLGVVCDLLRDLEGGGDVGLWEGGYGEAANLYTEEAEQDVVRGVAVLRVILEAVALEPLGDVRSPVGGADLHGLGGEGVAELRQPSVPLPVAQEAVSVGEGLPSLREGDVR